MVICTDKTIGLGKKTGISYRTAWRWWKQGNLTGYQLPSGTIITTDNNVSSRKTHYQERTSILGGDR